MFRKLLDVLDQLTGSEFESDQTLVTRFLSLLTLPFRFAFQFVAFLLTYWSSSRSFPAFLRAIPALFFGGIFLFSLIVSNVLLESTRVSQYEARYANELNKAEDLEMATNYAEKLMMLLPDEMRYHYQYGLAKFQAGDVLGALDVMKYIAEEHRNPEAQVWLARTMARDDSIDLVGEDERNMQCIKYYESAVENLNPEDDLVAYTEAHLGLAEAYGKESEKAGTEEEKNQWKDKQIGSLEKVISTEIIYLKQIGAYPMVIKFYYDQGEFGKAKAVLANAINTVVPISLRHPDNNQIRTFLVSSCMILNDFEAADSLIQEGMQLATTPESRIAISQLHSAILLKSAENIRDISTPERFTMQLERTARAVIVNPQNGAAYERLLGYIAPENPDENHDVWLRRSIIGSRTPAVINILLGFRAFNRGEFLEGERHWEIAGSEDPRADVIVNHLIRFSHTQDDGRIENLLDIASIGVQTFPNRPAFYVTRGLMYLKRKNYDSAVKDLEVAARQISNAKGLHELLVQGYQGLGNQSKVAYHQAEVDRLEQEEEAARMTRVDGRQ